MPDVLLHGVVGNTFSRQHVLLLTYVLPLTVLMSLLVIGRIPWIEKRKLIAPFGLAGIWLSGGLAMSISATFSGGGFATLDGWRGVVLGAIPPFTFMMASYDGSLFALLLTTRFMPSGTYHCSESVARAGFGSSTTKGRRA